MKIKSVIAVLIFISGLVNLEAQDLNAINGSGFNIKTTKTPVNGPENTHILGLQSEWDSNYKWQLVNAYNTDNFYLRRYVRGWGQYCKIWHSGNFDPNQLNPSSINLNVPSKHEPLTAMTINVQSFNTIPNSQKSYFLKVQDIGSNRTQFAIRGDGNVGIGTDKPGVKLDVIGKTQAHELLVYAPSKSDPITAMTINAQSFITDVNSRNSYFLKATDLGNGKTRFIIRGDGNVGIGTDNPDSKLSVNGTIHAQEIKVDMIGWADFVFEEEYELKSLEETEQFILNNKHLPDIPNKAEVEENGINLGDMNAKLLQKIEELTLYMITINKELKSVQAKNIKMEEEIGILLGK